MITTRPASEADLEQYKSIRLRALKTNPEAFGSTYEKARQRDGEQWLQGMRRMMAAGRFQFVFDAERCVGLAAIYREGTAGSGELCQMWVEPEQRGGSAATVLVRALLDWAEEAGVDRVELGVARDNERATRFYEKMGFVKTGECAITDPERGMECLRMRAEFS